MIFVFRVAGHLGVWAGFYALAAFICLCQLAGQTGEWRRHGWAASGLPRWDAMLCVLLTATAVYGLDRVKLSSRWIDPADIAAQPARYEFLARWDLPVRVFALGCAVVAAFVGWTIHPLAPWIVLLSAAGTVAYAPRPRNKIARIKDRLWLKNAYVAVALSLFVWVMAALSTERTRDGAASVFEANAPLGTAAAVVALRVFFDAALCDIDDETTDRAFSTATFATAWGSLWVWNWAGVGRFLLAAALPFLTWLPWRPRLAWCAAMILGMIALRWRRPKHIRDTVDMRFLPEAFLVAAVLATA